MRAWARKHGLTAGHVSRVLSGEKEPGEAILKPLGFEAETIYRAVGRAPYWYGIATMCMVNALIGVARHFALRSRERNAAWARGARPEINRRF